MKKSMLTAVAFLAIILSTGVAMAITQQQAIVTPVLESLKLKSVPSKVVGGPQRFKVTKETLELLKKAMEEDKVIVLDSDGSIKFEKSQKGNEE